MSWALNLARLSRCSVEISHYQGLILKGEGQELVIRVCVCVAFRDLGALACHKAAWRSLRTWSSRVVRIR